MGRGEGSNHSEAQASKITFLNPEKVEEFYRPLLIQGKSLTGAVAAPERAFHYQGETDILKLAATLCLAVNRMHALADGNKRASAVLTDAFLMANGLRLKGTVEELSRLFWSVGAGELDEEQIARELQLLTAFGPHELSFDERYPEVIDNLAQ